MKKICLRLFLLSILFHFPNLYTQDFDLSVQTGHSLSIQHLCFSPDGKLLVSSGLDNCIILWDVATGKQIRMFKGHTAPVNKTVFHPGNELIISVSEDYTLKVWNIKNGTLIKSLHFPDSPLKTVDINKSGNLLAAAGKNVYLIPINNWEPNRVKELENSKIYNCITFNTAGNEIALGSIRKGKVLLYDLDKKVVKKTFTFRCKELAFSNDDRFLAGAGVYGKLRKWDVQSKMQFVTRYSIPEKRWIDSYFSVSISNNGEYFAGANQNHLINVYSMKKGKTVLIIKGHTDKVNALAFSPEGNILASSGSDRIIYLWDVSEKEQVKSLYGIGGKINCLSVPDSNSILIGLDDGSCKLVDINPLGKIKTTHLKSPYYKQLLRWEIVPEKMITGQKNDQIIIQTDMYKEIVKIHKYKIKHQFNYRIWDIHSNSTKKLKHPKGEGVMNNENLAFFNWHKGKLFILQGKDSNYKEFTEYTLPSVKINQNQFYKEWFSIDYNKLFITYLISDSVYEAKIFDLNNCKLISSEQYTSPITGVDFFNENHVLLSFNNNTLIVKDFIQNTILGTQDGGPPFLRVANTIYFTYNDNTIKMMDLDNLKETTVLNGSHSNQITSLQKINTKNSEMIVSGSIDGTVKFWDAAKKSVTASLITIGDFDKIFITPSNYYYASKGALQGVGFAHGTDIHSFEQFDILFNRPDIVFTSLNIADTNLIKYYYAAYLKRLDKLGLTPENLAHITSNIPKIEINEDEIPLTTKDNTIIIKYTASDATYLLERVKITINGVPWHKEEDLNLKAYKTQKYTDEIPLELSQGKNNIQLSVQNSNGAESIKKLIEINYKGDKKKPDLYLVTVGVAKYRQSQFNLNYADIDAEEILSLFYKSKHLYDNIYYKKLINDEVTLDKLTDIEYFLTDAGVDDIVLIFLAGHGILSTNLDYYFATYDMDFQMPQKRGIPYSKIEALLDKTKSRKKLLFLDACHSGEFDKDEVALMENTSIEYGEITFRNVGPNIENKSTLGSKSVFEFSKMLFADLRENSGSIVISAAGGAEYAIEGEEWGNGIFTYCLISGIKSKAADNNNDGKILVSELQRYIFENVYNITNGRQQPTSRLENLVNDFRIW